MLVITDSYGVKVVTRFFRAFRCNRVATVVELSLEIGAQLMLCFALFELSQTGYARDLQIVS